MAIRSEDYDKAQRRFQAYWVRQMKGLDAYWLHDGNPKRPYARLTTDEMVSNFYANCTTLSRNPDLLGQSVRHLIRLFNIKSDRDLPDAVVGSAYGAITLGYEIGRQLGIEAWFTTKNGKQMELDRFDFTPEVETVLLCEDVITSFTTTRNSIAAIKKNAPGNLEPNSLISPYVLTIVNRTGQREIDGYRIITLIEESSAKTWKEGSNPFTIDGAELVPPVRPKSYWDDLTQQY